MPMTILWALENLHDNDTWASQDIIIIHILGAQNLEVMNGQIFEEILHRLPKVKTLKLVLRGLEIMTVIHPSGLNKSMDMDPCPECRRRGRKKVHVHVADPYHEYARTQRSRFTKPDLAVAFNSSCSQEEVDSWKETITFLVKQKIPTTFTAYNKEEAEDEAEIFESAGAQLVPSLGPVKNPWASLLIKTEPNKVSGFYAVNGWLAGGFK